MGQWGESAGRESQEVRLEIFQPNFFRERGKARVAHVDAAYPELALRAGLPLATLDAAPRNAFLAMGAALFSSPHRV
mgnify:CR=1 FL=1